MQMHKIKGSYGNKLNTTANCKGTTKQMLGRSQWQLW